MRLASPKRMHRRIVEQKIARESNTGVKGGWSKSHSPLALQFAFRTHNARIRIIKASATTKDIHTDYTYVCLLTTHYKDGFNPFVLY